MYRPIQPGIATHPNSAGLQYQEFVPHPELRSRIHCYWQITSTDEPLEPFIYRVIPDGCVDLLMNVVDYEGALIASTMREPAYVPFAGKTGYVGVRFLPGCAGLFLDVPLPDLLDTMAFIQDTRIVRDTMLETRLFEATDMTSRCQQLDAHFLKRLHASDAAPDKRVSAALRLIYQAQGNLPSQTLAEVTGSRHLRRLFQKYTGTTPKTISRVVRFQALMQTLLCKPNTFQQQSFDAGYYDQSHLIREFKALYGDTPTHFLHSLNFSNHKYHEHY